MPQRTRSDAGAPARRLEGTAQAVSDLQAAAAFRSRRPGRTAGDPAARVLRTASRSAARIQRTRRAPGRPRISAAPGLARAGDDHRARNAARPITEAPG